MSMIFPNIMEKSTADVSSWSFGVSPPSLQKKMKNSCMGPSVLQQLKGQFSLEPRYFSHKRGEIDFVVQHGTEIIPTEVKGREDKSAPSFKHYVSEHSPEHVLRFSRRGYVTNEGITNLPLYLAPKTRELL